MLRNQNDIFKNMYKAFFHDFIVNDALKSYNEHNFQVLTHMSCVGLDMQAFKRGSWFTNFG